MNVIFDDVWLCFPLHLNDPITKLRMTCAAEPQQWHSGLAPGSTSAPARKPPLTGAGRAA